MDNMVFCKGWGKSLSTSKIHDLRDVNNEAFRYCIKQALKFDTNKE